VICLLGATPVFVDIDPHSYNINSSAIEDTIKICLKESKNVRGIIAVDLFGLSADYDTINDIAKQYNLFVIEDAAQSFGAIYKDQRTCSLADISCTSFFPAKPLGGYGDGGMCFTDDDTHAAKIRSLMLHGQGSHRYEHIHIGINGRLDTMQAAILLEKFDIFQDELLARQHVADRYTMAFKKNKSIITPYIPLYSQSSWAQYSIQVESSRQREHLQKHLQDNGIPSAIYYPIPIHQQPAFQKTNKKSFPVSETISQKIMSLPMHPYLTKDQQDIIISTVLKGLE
jgi:dTDP-4-amino-4,6-dideoxygalactose transaminase